MIGQPTSNYDDLSVLLITMELPCCVCWSCVFGVADVILLCKRCRVYIIARFHPSLSLLFDRFVGALSGVFVSLAVRRNCTGRNLSSSLCGVFVVLQPVFHRKMTIDHPTGPDVQLVEEKTLKSCPRSQSLAMTACTAEESSGMSEAKDCTAAVNGCRRSRTSSSSSYVQSFDEDTDGVLTPPPVPPRPPETLSSDSTPPDSPLGSWSPLPMPRSDAGRHPFARRASSQVTRPEMEGLRRLRRLTTLSASSLPHAPLRPCKSEAEPRERPQASAKMSRTLSDGALKLKRSISSLFGRRSSNTKLESPDGSAATSPVDNRDVDKALERYRERLRHDMFPNSGEIQFVKSDEPPPPLPPRNWENWDMEPKERPLPPRNWQKSRRTNATHRWGGSSNWRWPTNGDGLILL